VGVAVLRTLLGLRRQIAALHAELATQSLAVGAHGLVPQARASEDTDRIRAAVAEALAEERERELAEARAFWAAQEARDASDAPSLLGLPDSELFLPRPADFAGLESLEPVSEAGTDTDEFAGESAELAAARRRHPSHPDFVPAQSPGVNDHERTVACLEDLADSRTTLADVRPGPLGTLDVYVFTDGTTLCMTPGPNPVIFTGDLYPGRIYKVSLDGKVLGVYGKSGKNLGEFGWIHAIACPSENEIWVGELLNWRVQKLVVKGGQRSGR
jgi:hypothetical protein